MSFKWNLTDVIRGTVSYHTKIRFFKNKGV